jgi:hypothetical protein
MKKFSFIVLTMMLGSVAAPICLGCECVQVGAPDTKKWLKEGKGAIFAGEVIKIEEIQIPLSDRPEYFYLKRQVTLKVLKRWKNADSDEMVIRTGIGGGDCGIHFAERQQYLVDAYELNGELETGICTSTRRRSDAAKLIKELDEIVETKKKGT